MGTTEEERNNTPAYIGRRKCGCMVTMVVDDGLHPDMVRGTIKEMADDGLIIERTTVGFCREHAFEKCKDHGATQPSLIENVP